jgi:hypothetical protein
VFVVRPDDFLLAVTAAQDEDSYDWRILTPGPE